MFHLMRSCVIGIKPIASLLKGHRNSCVKNQQLKFKVVLSVSRELIQRETRIKGAAEAEHKSINF